MSSAHARIRSRSTRRSFHALSSGASGPGRSRFTAMAPSPRLHLYRQRRRGELARGQGARGAGRGVQRRVRKPREPPRDHRAARGDPGATPRAATHPARAGDVAHTLADVSKAKRLLGYAPLVDFRRGGPGRALPSRPCTPRVCAGAAADARSAQSASTPAAAALDVPQRSSSWDDDVSSIHRRREPLVEVDQRRVAQQPLRLRDVASVCATSPARAGCVAARGVAPGSPRAAR